MQTCTLCHAVSPDTVDECVRCHADLAHVSTTAQARADLLANPRVFRIRLIVAGDACPACREVQGDYAKESLPTLPTPGCSHHHGCRCFYEPVLVEVYP